MKTETKVTLLHTLSTASLLAGLFFALNAEAQVHILTYHNDNSRTGQNVNETILTPAIVNTNSFGKLFAYSVDGAVYAQPLYVSGLDIPGKGTRNVVFIATQHNSIYAFDADSKAGPGSGLLWHTNVGPSAATPNSDFGNRYGPYDDIAPEVGITGTPVIDLAAGTIYFDAFTHESPNYYHSLHALNITNGLARPFSPVRVTASVPGAGVDSSNGAVVFNPMQQLQRSALTLAGGNLYVAYAGYADTDPYHGWVIGYDAGTLQQLTNYTFNVTPNSAVNEFGENAGEGGIWMSGCGLAVDANTNLYFSTGNGSFDATNGLSRTEYGDSYIRLSTTNGLAVADYFTPYNQEFLATNDIDLGSSGALLLPDSVGSLAHPRLLVGSGKEGTIYLLDRDNLGQFNPANNSQIVQELTNAFGGAWSSPAYFNDRVYFQGRSSVDGMKAYQFSNGLLSVTPVSQSPTPFGFPGATPSISANGTNNAIVWTLQSDGFRNGMPAVLRAYDAYDLSRELYHSEQAGARDRAGEAVKFTVPTIANGKVYVGAQSSVTVYGLRAAPPASLTGIYQGLFSDPNGVAHHSSGFFKTTIAKSGRYTGTLQVGGRKYPFAGQFSATGEASSSIRRRNQDPIVLQLNLGTNQIITGQIVGGIEWTAELIAYRLIYSKSNPAPQAGKFTIVIPGRADSAAAPGGEGFARITVDRSGHVILSGKLADGTAIAQRSIVSEPGLWPFHASLYSGNGSILGWLSFFSQLTNDISGQVDWVKLAQPAAKLYPAGFTNQTEVAGSTYFFTAGTPILEFSSGRVWLANGNLPQGFTNEVVLTGNKLIGTNKTALVISSASGLFKGKVMDPSGGAIPVRGAVLQRQGLGSGHFLGTDESGRVRLEPAP